MTQRPDELEATKRPSPAQTWCQVLESYGLDRDQAEALTRIVAIRAKAWHAQCKSLISDPKVRSVLAPSPTNPSALREGLELYLAKLAAPERDRPPKPRQRGGPAERPPRRRLTSP